MRKIVAQESQTIILGHWAENEATCVEFDITGWEDCYGSGGHFDVLAKRQGDADYYPCQTHRDGNKLLWIVSNADTAIMGQGTCGLVYCVGDVVAKSVIYSTIVTEGVTNSSDVPEPWEDWTNSILQASAGIQQSASAASQTAIYSQESAETSEAYAIGKRNGADISPTDPAYQNNAKYYAEQAESKLASAVKHTTQTLTDEQKQQARHNIGLGNVGNTADADKPVSTAQQAALDLKADKTALGRTDRSLDYLWKKSEGILYDTETVLSNANTVTVPSGAMEYASMDMLGGMSRKGRQLFDTLHAVDGQSKTHNGVTFIVQPDGGVNCVGTATENAYFYINKSNISRIQLQANCALIFSANKPYDTFGINTQFDMYEDGVYVETLQMPTGSGKRRTYHGSVSIGIARISVPKGVAVDFIYYPMLEYGTVVHPYEPYTDSLIEAKVDKITSRKADTEIIAEKTIPQSVIALCPNYGQGTDESFNYIDLVEKKYHHKGGMDGDGVWTELATEEVIDLSAVIPEDFEILPVEMGGTVQYHYPELDNGYSIGVPNNVTYMVNVAEVTA